jgi:Tol biopolymer transport system component
MAVMRWALLVLLLVPVAGGGGLLGLTALDWSRDGRHVLFVDEGEVWVGLAPEGRHARRLTTGAATDWARFGPGDWLVYVALTETGWGLWRSDLDGERRLLFSQADLARQADAPRIDLIARPTVSPDGKSVAFVAYADDQCDLFLLDLESRSVRRLTRTPGPEDTPDFSPNGRFLVFVGLWGAGPVLSWDLYILDLEGHGIEQLTEDPFFDWCPRFSPDGEWIAFESAARGPSDIHVLRRDGRERTAFTFDEWRDAFPCWGPTGDEIGYGSRRPAGWLILADKTS